MFVGREKEMLEQANTRPQDFFICKKDWPICRFNYLRPHLITETFDFKSDHLPTIYQDYFSQDKMHLRTTPKRIMKTTVQDILIERDYHYCKIKDFTQNMGTAFCEKSDRLFTCKYLEIDKKFMRIKAHKQVLKFCKFILNKHKLLCW